MGFASLSPTYDPKATESQVREYWDRIGLPSLIAKSRANAKTIGFVEGPPTMNGEPHIGHIRGRIMKDLWYRFSILNGNYVVFRAGWDTQGLPVELQAEKELGLTGSKAENLATIGEEKLVEACKALVKKYNERWVFCDKLLGMSLDYDEAYWTYKDEYIEREWKYLQRALKAGLLGEGFRVVPYCPSCQTSLSHGEVGQGYETVTDPSVYFKMKLKDENDTYLILWTTMPFTIVTDELVGVKLDADYSYVRVGEEIWIVASNRLEGVMNELGIKDYSVKAEVKGKDLEGKKYIFSLLDVVPGQAKLDSHPLVHTVLAEDFVDITAGSGLVHMSPANGEEDFEVASRRKIPVFVPFDDAVRFTEEAGIFQGLFARDADDKVINFLKEKKLILLASTTSHEYPCCWRSKHKLVWLARREYFYWVDRIYDQALKAAEGVEYYYPQAKNRFLEIIKEAVPWCISRERVWGTPLPIWVCRNCNEKIFIFSREEIVKRAVSLPDGPSFELHRPWIDRIIMRCERCGGEAGRDPFVLDTWHNSGAAPFASFGEKGYGSYVPVPFLTEGIDQTRGWAYSLLMENIILTGKAQSPYKSFLFQGHVLDENGNKMSKSLGNIVEGIDTLRKNSVDILRYYMLWKAAPIDSLNFSSSEMMGRPYQVLSTLYHLHIYFNQNSRFDGFSEARHTLSWAEKKGLLRKEEVWILSKLYSTVEDAKRRCKLGRYHEATRSIESFIIEDLSQRYVPLTRREIWEDDLKTRPRRLAIYATLRYVIKAIDIALHPVAPYLTEYLYQNTFVSKREAIILEEWPKLRASLSRKEVEKDLSTIFEIASLANSARSKAKLKRRWPLKVAIVQVPRDTASRLRRYIRIIKELMNVRELRFVTTTKVLPMELRIIPKPERLGPRLKLDLAKVISALAKTDPQKILEKVSKGPLKLKLEDKAIEIYEDDLEFERVPKDGYTLSGSHGGLLVALKVSRERELVSEGLIRDLARRLQFLRKEMGLNPTEKVEEAIIAGLDKEASSMIAGKLEELAYLVRAKRVYVLEKPTDGISWQSSDLDGIPVKLAVISSLPS